MCAHTCTFSTFLEGDCHLSSHAVFPRYGATTKHFLKVTSFNASTGRYVNNKRHHQACAPSGTIVTPKGTRKKHTSLRVRKHKRDSSRAGKVSCCDAAPLC